MAVNVKDMFYAQTTSDAIKGKCECGGAVTTLLEYALESKAVDMVVAVTKGYDLYDGKITVVTKPEDVIKTAGSLHTAPVNLGKFIAQYLEGAKDKKIAVTVKPCDARTITTLAKMGKINLDNVLMIGVNCGGTISPVAGREMIEKLYGTNPDDVIKEEIDKGQFIIVNKAHEHKGIKVDDLEEKGMGRRNNCQRCDTKIPRMADLACGNWGIIGPLAGKATFVEVCSTKGAKLMDGAINAKLLTVSAPDPKGLEIREKTNGAMLKLAAKHQKEQFRESSPEFWAQEFSKCIKCMGCTVHCPVLAFKQFKVPAHEPRGTIPPMMTYHISKAAALGADCINCGGCEDVCPMDIPLSKLYHDVAMRLEH